MSAGILRERECSPVWPASHRVAISNRRLISTGEAGITFRYKDYRRDGTARYQAMTLGLAELIRRFLLHVLPRRALKRSIAPAAGKTDKDYQLVPLPGIVTALAGSLKTQIPIATARRTRVRSSETFVRLRRPILFTISAIADRPDKWLLPSTTDVVRTPPRNRKQSLERGVLYKVA
jgi:hypothetical protein